ncbi:hypothetical protein IGI04_030007 [Brassica rapa subsp. trilocularis]|uniref:Uncharacterized protein n=1 Tax=Brassica rapa subsp. trilocularis TaxID=1813537 RepID=A0ABQ7LRT3_BRACM|nr:hypothetical protein IGI04_030007 [Brassica rapa subsp. trilocularis]
MLNQMVGRIKAKPGSKAEMGEPLCCLEVTSWEHLFSLTISLDFDDDDINVHFSQDEISRVGACSIVNVKNQYVRPSSEDPLQALIQNSVSFFSVMSQDKNLRREKGLRNPKNLRREKGLRNLKLEPLESRARGKRM